MVDLLDNHQMGEVKIIEPFTIVKVEITSNQMCKCLAKINVNSTKIHRQEPELQQQDLASNQALLV